MRVAVVCLGALLASCNRPAPSVVVYASVDQVYSEPVFKAFEQRTGIRVLPVYDVEAAKTTGLVNRLAAEKSRPVADVFWSGEFAQTVLLGERGVLAPYAPRAAASARAECSDPAGYWTCFGGRARVLLVNTRLAKPGAVPAEVLRLADGDFPPQSIAVANPLFGTSFTHAAALYATLGASPAQSFYRRLVDRGVKIAEGNSEVRNLVERGEVALGLTDSDDACASIASGAPVRAIVPDQEGGGTLVIPNSVALIAGAPHPTQAKELIEYLLSSEVEDRLIQAGWVQASARAAAGSCLGAGAIKPMTVAAASVVRQMDRARKELSEIFLK